MSDKQAILLAAQGGSGDILNFSVVIRAFRKKFPGDQIIVLATHDYILQYNPNIDRLLAFGNIKDIRDIYNDYIYGDKKKLRFYKHHFPYTAFHDEIRQEAKNLPDFLCRRYDIEYDSESLDYYISPYEENASQAFRRQFEKPIVLLHLTGVLPLKSLSPHIVEPLVRKYSNRFDFIQTGAANEPVIEGVHNATGMPIRDVASVLRYSKANIVIESVFGHLAGALELDNTIVVFQSTDPAFFGHPNNHNIWELDIEKCPQHGHCNLPIGELSRYLPSYLALDTGAPLPYLCPNQVCNQLKTADLEKVFLEVIAASDEKEKLKAENVLLKILPQRGRVRSTGRLQMQQQMIKLRKGKKFHVIFFQGDKSSCSAYRGLFPLAALTDNNRSEDHSFEITGVLEKRHLQGHIPGQSVAIFQRQMFADVFSPMMLMKEAGVKIIYEIDDDLFTIPKGNPARAFYKHKTVKDNIKMFLSNVDAVFVTQKYLADLYSDYNENIYILENCINFKVMSDPPRNSAKPVVLWQGSPTHEKDISVFKKGLIRLIKDKDVFVTLWNYPLQGAHQPGFVPFEAFFQMYAQLDPYLGLAPLVPNSFNKCKSNLKFLEYSALKIPTIASDFGEYKRTIIDGETGILVGNTNQVYDAIRFLIDNPDERERIGTNAYNFVKENFDIDKNYILWKNAIDEVLAM